MSETRLRRLDSRGINELASYLQQLREDPTLEPPIQLLTDPNTSSPVHEGPTVARPGFQTKGDAARYLHKILSPDRLPNLSQDVELWSWLALYYFDDICPKVDGRRRPKADAHYIYDPDHRRRYRHLLRTPYQILDAVPEHNRIFLEQPVSVHGELVEQVFGGRLYVIRIPGVAAAIEELYLDRETGSPRRGYTNRRRRGNIRERLSARVRQLMLTHDIAGLDGMGLIDLLGQEFASWST